MESVAVMGATTAASAILSDRAGRRRTLLVATGMAAVWSAGMPALVGRGSIWGIAEQSRTAPTTDAAPHARETAPGRLWTAQGEAAGATVWHTADVAVAQ